MGPQGAVVGTHSPQDEHQTCRRTLAYREGALDCQLHGDRRHREAEEPEQRADGSQSDCLSPQLGHLGSKSHRSRQSDTPQPGHQPHQALHQH